jgi:hypothetical protein
MWQEIKVTYDGVYDAMAPLKALDPTCRWVECVDKKMVFLGKGFQISYLGKGEGCKVFFSPELRALLDRAVPARHRL